MHRERARVEIPTDELPRRVPQDPESVRNEQEVRRKAAELQPPRLPSPEELDALRESVRQQLTEGGCDKEFPLPGGVLDIDPSNAHRDERIAGLERRVAELEERLLRRFGA